MSAENIITTKHSNKMKRFEHAIILIGGILIAFGLVIAMLWNEAQREQKEIERRKDLYLILDDDNN